MRSAPKTETKAAARKTREGDSDVGDHDAAKQSGRQSLKSSYMTKVLSPLIGYGTDYALFQFVYDLHMWTMLGAKKHVRGGEVPLRVLFVERCILLAVVLAPTTPRIDRCAAPAGVRDAVLHDVALRMVVPVPPVDA